MKIKIYQILLLIIILGLWEILTKCNIIDSFIFSSPSNIINTTIHIPDLLMHIYTTLKEVLISFILGISLGFIIAKSCIPIES